MTYKVPITVELSTGQDAGKVATSDGAGGVTWGEPAATAENIFIAQLAAGTLSDELFTIANGVNEFDLSYENGAYHLFYTEYSASTHYRTAATIAGLDAAADSEPSTGLYPSAFLDGSTWHIWVWQVAQNATRHYTATDPTGTWTYVDQMAASLADIHVRKWDYNGKYYATYKHISTLRAGIMEADDPAGPWTDKGYIFDALTGYHSNEEADPAIFFIGQSAYVSFSGWNNTQQVVAVVALDMTTFRAKDAGTVLVEPTAAWQQRNSSLKVFNPVWLDYDHHMYYSHNPSATGITTGWGYLELPVFSDATGTGDVTGPGSAVDGNFAAFDGTGGKTIKDSGSKAADFATAGHTHALDNLSDVSTSGQATGDVLYKSSGDWQPYPLGLGSKVTVDGNKIKFGNVSGANYLEIDTTTGNLRLVGNATAWDDLRISGSSVRLGVTAPALAAFGPSGNLRTLRFESGKDEEIHFEIQMPHQWKEGSRIYPHVHWSPVSTTTGNVVWTLDYSWASINGTFGAPTTMNSDAAAAGGVAWVHKITQVKDGSGNTYIDGTGQTLSSMLVCRLHRNAGAGSDTLAADVAFLEFDIHFEVDSFGSDTEYQKDTQIIRLLEDGSTRTMESGVSRLQE